MVYSDADEIRRLREIIGKQAKSLETAISIIEKLTTNQLILKEQVIKLGGVPSYVKY